MNVWGQTTAMIFLHSGSWKAGDKSQFHDHCEYFAEHLDVPCFAMNYRLCPEFRYPAPLEDIDTMINWIAGEYPFICKRAFSCGWLFSRG